MKSTMKINIAAGIAGLFLAAGLSIGGVTNPNYIQGLLNIGGLFDSRLGHWYPRIIFVIIGASIVLFFVFRYTDTNQRKIKSKLQSEFYCPEEKKINKQLISGAILFGIGLGLYGYFPTTAIANLLVAGWHIFIFVICMLVGMLVAKGYTVEKNNH